MRGHMVLSVYMHRTIKLRGLNVSVQLSPLCNYGDALIILILVNLIRFLAALNVRE